MFWLLNLCLYWTGNLGFDLRLFSCNTYQRSLSDDIIVERLEQLRYLLVCCVVDSIVVVVITVTVRKRFKQKITLSQIVKVASFQICDTQDTNPQFVFCNLFLFSVFL